MNDMLICPPFTLIPKIVDAVRAQTIPRDLSREQELTGELADLRLRPTEGYRLYERRAELIEKLLEDVRGRREAMESESEYPLAPLG